MATPSSPKERVAWVSLVAAVFLTAIKLVVGLLTNSLGLLSEALHSGLDLVATAVTLMAVRLASKPPDATHHYGHGKAENLAAFVETLLLLLTCAWIIWEAIERLFLKSVHVEATWASFAVMAISIVVDATRSRALRRAAREHRSQALEADAIHFQTDIWSSTVVILGLVGVWAGQHMGRPELWNRADAVAALVVAGVVTWVSYQLGRRSVAVLLDRAPLEYLDQIRGAAGQVTGVDDVARIRVRDAGSRTFVDLVVHVDGRLPVDQSHEIAQAVEEAVVGALPEADVVVHVEPGEVEEEGLVPQIRTLASRMGQLVHHVGVQRIGQQLYIDLDLEIEEEVTLEEAHQTASELERALRDTLPNVAAVNTRLEAREPRILPVRDVTRHRDEIHRQVLACVRSFQEVCDVHNIHVREAGDRLYLTLHCGLNGNLPIRQAHRLASQIEQCLSEQIPQLRRVTVHTEPFQRHRPRRRRRPLSAGD